MKNQPGLLLLFLLLVGCKKESIMRFSSKNFTEETFTICKTLSCPSITVNYIEALGEDSTSKKVNSEIVSFITNALLTNKERILKDLTISEAATEFLKVARLHSADFPDMSAEYFADINISALYFSPELVSIEMRQYLYTGGAHGNEKTVFMNIDPQSGEKIISEDLFKNSLYFTNFAEKRFREAHNILPSESINFTGFWFKNDIFYLPETIGFTKTNCILRYDQYEIANYAEGPIELKIPIEEAKSYLNFKVTP
tara:strand:+ start:92 stop:856 length:765 start_codon:yes stop_codon:yes gene_type:complete